MTNEEALEQISFVMELLREVPIIVRKWTRKAMGTAAGAILLSQLMYWLTRAHKDNFRVWRTDKLLLTVTGLTPKELIRAKRDLKQLPFLNVERKGAPPKTYYTLHVPAFASWIRDYQNSGQVQTGPKGLSRHADSPKGNVQTRPKGMSRRSERESPYPPTEDRKRAKRQELSRGLARGSEKGSGEAPWNSMTEKLLQILKDSKHHARRSKIPTQGWSDAFRKIHEVDGWPIEDVKKVLEWYHSVVNREGDVHHLNRIYIPVAESGTSFRKKFQNLVAAMGREKPPEQEANEKAPGKITKFYLPSSEEE